MRRLGKASDVKRRLASALPSVDLEWRPYWRVSYVHIPYWLASGLPTMKLLRDGLTRWAVWCLHSWWTNGPGRRNETETMHPAWWASSLTLYGDMIRENFLYPWWGTLGVQVPWPRTVEVSRHPNPRLWRYITKVFLFCIDITWIQPAQRRRLRCSTREPQETPFIRCLSSSAF